MKNTNYGERFDELSALIYKAIDGHSVFLKIPAEELIACNMVQFLCVGWRADRFTFTAEFLS